ncbi:ATP-binding cassette domain-containing protein [Gracilibacillus sp. YIM 98692]|uniref:ABC transporter ATP-binding protein n=1 Tax=Gracilibacillus sp. YIM 98692 TaxID=2663532 RepID=UPI001F093154|nr:ATP-binding cassette domain-containing protein [Gracilibacillus sp. YIM 98692]
MLEAKEVTYRHPGGFYLLENIHFSIQKNEVVGLSGVSGAGKTTLAKILAGFLKPHYGTVNIQQQKRKAHPVQLIWQHPEQAVNPKWRIRKILQEAGNMDDTLFNELGIQSEWLTRFPQQLSGGELQRVCIARALMTNPDYVIADEVTTMLDPIAQAEIWQLLLRMADKKQFGLCVISHDRHLLDKVCDRIVRFEELSYD